MEETDIELYTFEDKNKLEKYGINQSNSPLVEVTLYPKADSKSDNTYVYIGMESDYVEERSKYDRFKLWYKGLFGCFSYERNQNIFTSESCYNETISFIMFSAFMLLLLIMMILAYVFRDI
jgi:hypothetical protein